MDKQREAFEAEFKKPDNRIEFDPTTGRYILSFMYDRLSKSVTTRLANEAEKYTGLYSAWQAATKQAETEISELRTQLAMTYPYQKTDEYLDHVKLIESLQAENKLLIEPNLKELHLDSKGLKIQLEGGALHLVAEAFVDQFKDSGATNYLEMSFDSLEGPLTVTMQRATGLTPGQKAYELEEKNGQLQAEIEQLKNPSEIFIIEEVSIDPMENLYSDAVTFKVVGFKSTEIAAKNAIEEMGLLKWKGWPLSQDHGEISKGRYKKLTTA